MTRSLALLADLVEELEASQRSYEDAMIHHLREVILILRIEIRTLTKCSHLFVGREIARRKRELRQCRKELAARMRPVSILAQTA